MAKVNEFTKVVDTIRDEITSSRKEADKSKTVPFGLERISKGRDAARRFPDMTPDEKKKFIQMHGLSQTIRMLRGNNAS